jgi:hypothetical protein
MVGEKERELLLRDGRTAREERRSVLLLRSENGRCKEVVYALREQPEGNEEGRRREHQDLRCGSRS